MRVFLPKISEDSKLMDEWDHEKNQGISPEELTRGSNVKVWWRCRAGHSWETSPNHRNSGSGCPVCANKMVLAGYNDLASRNPELMQEWDYDKNKDILPEDCNYLSNRKVWWKCSQGHSWETSVFNRTRLERRCIYCLGQKAISGKNDLATTNPEIISEWDYERNKNVVPDMLMAGSNQKVWWKCSNGHSWQAAVYSRKKNGCPYCSGRKTLQGVNDLKTTNPVLAEEWDYEKNGTLTPEDTSIQSNKSVWWKCHRGHSWKAKPSERYSGNGCPECDGRIRMKTHYIS